MKGHGAATAPGMTLREAFLVTLTVLLAGVLWCMMFFRAGDPRLPHPNPRIITPQVALSDGSRFEVLQDAVEVVARSLSDADVDADASSGAVFAFLPIFLASTAQEMASRKSVLYLQGFSLPIMICKAWPLGHWNSFGSVPIANTDLQGPKSSGRKFLIFQTLSRVTW